MKRLLTIPEQYCAIGKTYKAALLCCSLFSQGRICLPDRRCRSAEVGS